MATRKFIDGETVNLSGGQVSIHEDLNGFVTFSLEGYGKLTMHSRHFWHWLQLRESHAKSIAKEHRPVDQELGVDPAKVSPASPHSEAA